MSQQSGFNYRQALRIVRPELTDTPQRIFDRLDLNRQPGAIEDFAPNCKTRISRREADPKTQAHPPVDPPIRENESKYV